MLGAEEQVRHCVNSVSILARALSLTFNGLENSKTLTP